MYKLLLLLLTSASVHATTVSFVGNWYTVESQPGVTHPLQVGDPVSASFTDEPVMSSYAKSGVHYVSADNVDVHYYPQLQVTQELLDAHGLHGVFDSSVLHVWDIVGAHSRFGDLGDYSLYHVFDPDHKKVFEFFEVWTPTTHATALAAVPIPAIGWLAMMSMAGLVGFRRR